MIELDGISHHLKYGGETVCFVLIFPSSFGLACVDFPISNLLYLIFLKKNLVTFEYSYSTSIYFFSSWTWTSSNVCLVSDFVLPSGAVFGDSFNRAESEEVGRKLWFSGHRKQSNGGINQG